MKKNYLVSIMLLLVIFLSGCANKDYYLIEKQYYRIKKEASKIYNNPFGSPPKELERVVGLFNDFAQKYPNTNLSLDAEFQVARLYAVKEEYAKAREKLKAISIKYPNAKSIVAEAIFLTGNTYQAQENWNAALEQYKTIIRQYPATTKGLRMPIYIAGYYRLKHQPDKMIAAYQEAVQHYKTLKAEKRNPLLNYLLSGLLARCYIELKEWENALLTYNAMLSEYNGKVNMENILMEMAVIYSKELKQKDKTREVLSLLVKHYPNSRYRKTAERILKALASPTPGEKSQ